MAKKGPRFLVRLKCEKCGGINYTSERSRVNTPEKLGLSKFCPHCRQHTQHVETSIK